jgi:hypothetical protein
MQAKKRVKAGATVLTTGESKPSQRPVGMQTMGPTIYEQIRRTLLEMELKLASEN